VWAVICCVCGVGGVMLCGRWYNVWAVIRFVAGDNLCGR